MILNEFIIDLGNGFRHLKRKTLLIRLVGKLLLMKLVCKIHLSYRNNKLYNWDDSNGLFCQLFTQRFLLKSTLAIIKTKKQCKKILFCREPFKSYFPEVAIKAVFGCRAVDAKWGVITGSFIMIVRK